MRTSRSVILAGALLWFGGALASASRPASTYLIAHRYDDTRVVFSLEKAFKADPDLRQRSLAQNPSRLPDPAAKLSGMTLWKMDEAFWQRHVNDLAVPAPGDRWVISAGGASTFNCAVERLAIAEVPCGTVIAVIAEVDRDEQSEFKNLSEKHFLVAPEADRVALPPKDSVPAILGQPPVLGTETRQKLETALDERFQRELARVHRTSAASYAQMARLGRQNLWPDRDDRLARGEGTLSYDLQALRLTPDGKLCYYVRAQWTLDKEVAFLMSAWTWPDRDLQFENVYTRPSEWLRMNEFQSERLGLDALGTLLNIFDYDGDGWGEVLIHQPAYEGFRMRLLKYFEGRGFRPTEISYRYGC